MVAHTIVSPNKRISVEISAEKRVSLTFFDYFWWTLNIFMFFINKILIKKLFPSRQKYTRN